MRFTNIVASLALTFSLGACATDGYGGYGGGTQLSQCARNALIGAGMGAVAGAVVGDDDSRGQSAAIGGAVGGLGTYAACQFFGGGGASAQRAEQAYLTAVQTGSAQRVPLADGRTLIVDPPRADPGNPNCRIIEPYVAGQDNIARPLPRERYCQTAQGGWTPANA